MTLLALWNEYPHITGWLAGSVICLALLGIVAWVDYLQEAAADKEFMRRSLQRRDYFEVNRDSSIAAFDARFARDMGIQA